MRLSSDILRKIIGRPVSRFLGSGHKRAIGRVAVQGTAIVYPVQGDYLDDPFPVSLRDISAETIGISSARALMPHSSLIISIPIGSDPSETLSIRCRVTRCSRTPGGIFHLAAQFVLVCQVRPQVNA